MQQSSLCNNKSKQNLSEKVISMDFCTLVSLSLFGKFIKNFPFSMRFALFTFIYRRLEAFLHLLSLLTEFGPKLVLVQQETLSKLQRNWLFLSISSARPLVLQESVGLLFHVIVGCLQSCLSSYGVFGFLQAFAIIRQIPFFFKILAEFFHKECSFRSVIYSQSPNTNIIKQSTKILGNLQSNRNFTMCLEILIVGNYNYTALYTVITQNTT